MSVQIIRKPPPTKSSNPDDYFRAVLLSVFGKDKGRELWLLGQDIAHTKYRLEWYEKLVGMLQTGDSRQIREYGQYRMLPVGFREFVESDHYMKAENLIWPKLMAELEELNDSGKYVEAVLTGSIGCGKSTGALYTIAYQLYKLSCYLDPHKVFDLDPATEILFIFQSINASLSKAVEYQRFKAMVEKAPFFQDQFPYDKDYLAELRFPNRIIVKPVSGSDSAAIGQNVIGGIIDEVNFMAVIEKSKMSDDGGTYDQAIEIYNSISRRRKSRFMVRGSLPGILCLVSSKRYPGQFTDIKMEEAKTDPTIFVFDKRSWDVQDANKFSGQWFKVFIGSPTKKPRILEEGEEVIDEEQHLIDQVPLEYLGEFRADIMKALRDIAGVSTLARYPYYVNLEYVSRSMGRVRNCFSKDRCTLMANDKLQVLDVFKDKSFPRLAHVDLGLTSDSAGLAIGYVDKFVSITRGDQIEILPHIVVEGVIEIPPPPGGEVLFYRIREVLYTFRDKLGVNLRWISLDSYQSIDTMQIMRQRGYTTGLQSMDVGTIPYDFAKMAFYDDRVDAPMVKKLLREVGSLEKDPKTGKIDHPPNGSKDLSDALTGVIFGLTMRREIWAQFNVPLVTMPPSISSVMKKKENLKEGESA